MGKLTKDEIEKLPNRFDTISFRTFFQLWYALQKGLPKEQKGEIFTKIGRTLGREFNDEGINTIEDLLVQLKHFLEEDWAITEKAIVKTVKDENGQISKISVMQDSCKMCYANTYFKLHDDGTPSCMFPQVMMGILSKVKNKFGFKNLKFEGVQKGAVGECEMTWNVK